MTDVGELDVELPGGGKIHLQSPDEVERWETLAKRYREDYQLTKVNDLAMLDTLLTQHMILYRAQRALSGFEPETDEENLPTGRMKEVVLKPTDQKRYNETIRDASKEIREIEKALGIDKKSREAGGKDTLKDWLLSIKKLGTEYGVHISERVVHYEEFVNELRWRLRLLENGDSEDRAYHGCTPDGILAWANEELAKLEQVDKDFAQERGKLFVGRV